MFHLISVVYKVFKSQVSFFPTLVDFRLSVCWIKGVCQIGLQTPDPVCSPHSFRSSRLVSIAFEETVWGWQGFFLDQGTRVLPLTWCQLFSRALCFLCSADCQHSDDASSPGTLQGQHSGGVRRRGHFTPSCFICHRLWQTTSPGC